jgi:hypothetical protein
MKRITVLFLALLCGCVTHLETWVYRADHGFLFPVEEEILLPSEPAKPGDFRPMELNTNLPPMTMAESIRRVAEDCGVTFPSGAFLRVDTNELTVTIRNTPENNDRFQQLMKPLGEGTFLHRIK